MDGLGGKGKTTAPEKGEQRERDDGRQKMLILLNDSEQPETEIRQAG